MVFFRAAGSGLAADVFPAERAALASVTLLVGSVEPLPVAFFSPVFSPVVFAIAIPSLLEAGYPPGKNKNELLKTFYYSTRVAYPPAGSPLQTELTFHVSPCLIQFHQFCQFFRCMSRLP